jgi:hypothetical protein
MTVADTQSQLDEARFIIGQQMARIAELEAEVQNLKAGLSAHEVLQSIYRNSASESARIRAATAALPMETPRLESVPPAIDLIAEEEPEPLAELVHKRRARQDLLCPQSVADLPPIEVIADGRSSNGHGRDDGHD